MPNGTIDPSVNYVEELGKTFNRDWPTISAAREDADEVLKLLYGSLSTFTSEDVDLVVFGSLARGEWTRGSDVDWTMLIDGQANPDHRRMASSITEQLADIQYKGMELAEPGSQGIFGNMSFSHEIVHNIGGESDTNRNTTQRILLLLEATSLTGSSGNANGAFERVARQILNRYLRSDSNFHETPDSASRIPRFLLNDIVRYWRTMCVDFAYKDWEQSGKKWALRNIKLRTSRKLLFVSGLLAAFSCFENDELSRTSDDSESHLLKLQRHLMDFVHSTPLNIIVWMLNDLGLSQKAIELVDLYEEFLSQINDLSVRTHLSKLSEADVYRDKTFLECRRISHELQTVLNDVFFVAETQLRKFTVEYGVF